MIVEFFALALVGSTGCYVRSQPDAVTKESIQVWQQEPRQELQPMPQYVQGYRSIVEERMAALRRNYQSDDFGAILRFIGNDDELFSLLLRGHQRIRERVGRSVPVALEYMQDPEEPEFERIYFVVNTGMDDFNQLYGVQRGLIRDWLAQEPKGLRARVALEVL